MKCLRCGEFIEGSIHFTVRGNVLCSACLLSLFGHFLVTSEGILLDPAVEAGHVLHRMCLDMGFFEIGSDFVDDTAILYVSFPNNYDDLWPYAKISLTKDENSSAFGISGLSVSVEIISAEDRVPDKIFRELKFILEGSGSENLGLDLSNSI